MEGERVSLFYNEGDEVETAWILKTKCWWALKHIGALVPSGPEHWRFTRRVELVPVGQTFWRAIPHSPLNID